MGLGALPSRAQSDLGGRSDRDAFFSGFITGPDFCTNFSLGGPRTYAFDSDGDGMADVCSLPHTRREAAARQNALEALGDNVSQQVLAAEVARACEELGGADFGDEGADDVCSTGELTPPPAGDPADRDAFFSGLITGPDFCTNFSLGGPRTYAFDSDGDGVADVCSLPHTRREAVARQNALEAIAKLHPEAYRTELDEARAELERTCAEPGDQNNPICAPEPTPTPTAIPTAAPVPRPVVVYRPVAPTDVILTRGDTQIDVSWAAPNSGGSRITRYQVQYRTANASDWIDWTPAGADGNPMRITARSTTITGLTNDTIYTIRVRAVNRVGNGPWSNLRSLAASDIPPTAPAAPAAPTLAAGRQSLIVAWIAPDNGGSTITDYDVQYRQYRVDGDTDWNDWDFTGTGTSTTITGLTNGSFYQAQLRASNTADGTGPGNWSAASARGAPGAPAVPAMLRAGAGESGQVVLSWDDPGNTTITGYQLTIDDETSTTTATATTTSYTATDLTDGTGYSFAVRAVNDAGTGDVATITAAPGQPAPPNELTAAAVGGQVVLSWGDPGNATILRYQVSATINDPDTDTDDDDRSWTTVALTTSYTATGLTAGTSYTFAVQAVNDYGDGQESTIIATPGAPAQVDRLAAAAVQGKNGQVKLSWEDPRNATITEYAVTIDDGTSSTTATATTTRYTATGLTKGDSYTFAVRAVNGAGEGPLSDSVTAAPGKPAKVADLAAAAVKDQDGHVKLSWEDPGNATITKYQLRTDDSASYNDITATPVLNGDGTTTNTLSYTATGLTKGVSYTFAVRAVNDAGNGNRSTIAAAPGPPAGPTGLAVTAIGSNEVKVVLSWDAGNATILRYQVSTTINDPATDTDDDDRSWTTVALTTSYTATGLTAGASYTFAVRAVNDYGDGQESTIIATPGAPAVPTGLAAAAVQGKRSHVLLSWNEPEPPNAAILHYQVSVTTDGPRSWTTITDSNANTTSYKATGLTEGVSYTFAVRARNYAAEGDEATITAAPGRPAAPYRLGAAAVDGQNGQVVLSWDAGNATILHYQVSVTTDGPRSWTTITDSNANTTSYKATGLTEGVSYTFAVRAVNDYGTGPESRITAASGQPAAPTDLGAAAVAEEDGQVTLSWTSPHNATIIGFWVSVTTDGSTNWSRFADSRDVSSYLARNLTEGTSYTFAVRAVNAYGNGLPSELITAAPGKPAKVADLAAAAVAGSEGHVKLSWTDPGNATITKYQFRTDSGAYANINLDDVASTTTTATATTTLSYTVETGLSAGTSYTFAVRAVNDFGYGDPSDPASATPS